MAELIFACEGMGQLSRLPGYRSVRRKEYYGGEYQILPGGEVSVRIEKGLDSAYSIINLRSSSQLKFRRNWRHIHQDRTDVSVLWFVKRGSIVISKASGRHVIRRDQCMITRSLQPFEMDCLLDEDMQHEVLHVVVATDMIRAHVPDNVTCGTALSTVQSDCRVALRTFEMLYEEGASVSHRAADGLASEAVRAIGSVFTSPKYDRPRSMGDKRFREIEHCIQHHLSNPDLTVEMVAREIGISYGYLLHVLKRRGASFSDILWTRRLARARDWLAAANMKHYSISKISYMAGFKSPAHFSRAFKNAAGLTPRAFRDQTPAALTSACENAEQSFKRSASAARGAGGQGRLES